VARNAHARGVSPGLSLSMASLKPDGCVVS